MALRSGAPPADWIAAHRRVWAAKPVLRAVYGRWFERLQAACGGRKPLVELGCGPGFLKERYPGVVATDISNNPYADVALDARALPFADGVIGSIVFVDVFHHLSQPAESLREAARVLRPGGRIAMIEPWIGVAGYLLYRYIHHEHCNQRVDPRRPWGSGAKAAMEGNAALPYLFFRPDGYLHQLNLPLAVVAREPFPAIPALLSGGFQPFSLLPPRLLGLAERIERIAAVVPRLTAMRCLVVLEKNDNRN